MMKNNPNQEQAIKCIDKNLSVIAGAGTGKTKVLTERFIYILENGQLPKGREIESIVAITFTKKASQEMISRIRSEIRSNFPKGEKWLRYYRDIEKANISTIHSFCLNILKENVIAADLDPMFEVIEEYEAKKMLSNAIVEVLDRQIEENKGIYDLFKKMKLDRSVSLIDDIASVYNEIRTVGLAIEEIKDITLNYLESIKPVNNSDLDSIRNLTKTLIENSKKNSKISKLVNDYFCKLFLDGGHVEDLDRIVTHIHENIGANKKQQENIDKLEDIIERVLKSLERENIEYYKGIFTVLSEIDLLYNNKKQVFGGLDYEDLQIKTDKLLENEAIREKYQNKYKYIMIDEFQDTNKLQKQIFYKISSKRKDLDRNNLFVVGDPKQSIYGFRGADLNVFNQVVADIEITNKEGLITMNQNYRTVNTVISFVNIIFSGLMKSDYSSLSSHKNSKNKIDIEVISKDNISVPQGVSESEYHRNLEAEQIAKRISSLVEAGKYQYKDFAMLFRATTRNYIYERALNKFAIPYYNIGSKGFFKQQEIIDIINALKSLNNIEDKISAIGFLRSNLIGVNDNTIYRIFNDKSKEQDILTVLEELLWSEIISECEKEKIKAALHIYKEYLKYAGVFGIVKTLENLLDKTLYINTTILKENGKQKVANIYKFVEIGREYEEKYIGNLEEFLTYIDDIRENDESLGEIEGENTDAVKMLTIHKSKGLEFPVVIIPEMGTKSPNFSKKFLYDEDKGLSIGLGKSNPIYNNIRKTKIENDKEETKRVLYVAMTRAENMIILGNQGKSAGFKKMIEELLNGQEYRLIDEIEIEDKQTTKVKLISDDLLDARIEDMCVGGKSLEAESFGRDYIPNLYSIDHYNREFQNRISISKYMVFKECRRKYFLEKHIKTANLENLDSIELELEEYEDLNLQKGSDSEISPIDKGLVVHEFCELYRSDMDKRKLVERILYKRAISFNEEIYSSIEKNINNYLKHYNEDYDSVHYEKAFFLQLDGAYINGYIDKLIIKNGKISIQDFKTNKVYNIEELVDKYTSQIQLYSYIAREILNLPIESASILFLENGRKVDIPVDQHSLKENINSIQEFIDFTKENSEIEEYIKTSKCNEYCRFTSMCNLKEEIPWESI